MTNLISLIGYIICMIVILLLASLISMNIIVRLVLKSNKSGNSRGDYNQNAEKPLEIHVLSMSEYYKDMKENPEQYGVIQIF